MSGLLFRAIAVVAANVAAAAGAAPPAPTAPPSVVTPAAPGEARNLPPATPARIALARKLVGYTQPPELMTSAVLKGWEEGIRSEGDSFSSLNSIQDGLGAKVAARGKAEIVGLVKDRIPQLHDRLATLFAANCSEQERSELITFYSSSAGAKIIRSITLSNAGAEALDDDKITADEAMKASREASRIAARTLDSAEQAEMIKFAFSAAGRRVKLIGPEVQAISAEWMTATMAEFGQRIEPIVTDMVEKAAAEAK